MANEIRTRTNFAGGLVEDAPLLVGATTLTSAGLASLPVIDTTNHAAIILDPDGIEGSPEIVWVTAHTASATTATIARAQEGTTDREHRQDTPWVHTATASDFGDTWVTYTPNWTATSNPAIGDGIISGAYQIQGKTLHLRIEITMGPTTTFGSGDWELHLPANVTAKTGASQAGTVWASDSGTSFYTGSAIIGTATTLFDRFKLNSSGVATFWQSAVPHAWANGDQLAINAILEID